LASVLIKIINNGDAHSLAIILDQVAGKPKERREHNLNIGVQEFTPEQLRRMAIEVIENPIIDIESNPSEST